MEGSFNFLRHKNGICAFARIGVGCEPSTELVVEWAPDLAQLEKKYGWYVLTGIGLAMIWHRELGGGTARFRVLSLVESLMDTTPDAVHVAATVAAWKALGHSETELEFIGEMKPRWRVAKAK